MQLLPSRPLRTSSICAQCYLRLARRHHQRRRNFSTTTSSTDGIANSSSSPSSSHSLPQSTPIPTPPSSGLAKLTNRALISLHGHDAAHFLQGLTTANIRAGNTSATYSAFLTAQGRVLHDVFIYPVAHSEIYTATLQNPGSSSISAGDDAFLIEVDAAEVDRLYSHLKRYKLRAKVKIGKIDKDEWSVWSVWNGEERWTAHSSAEKEGSDTSATADEIGMTDARAPGMGHRLIVPGGRDPALKTHVQRASLESYTIRRIIRGVAEGQREILRESALPLESNVDYMGGVDFRKGCYVGQELTIRTHHTGVVRKRILPMMLYPIGVSAPEELRYVSDGVAASSTSNSNIVAQGKRGRAAGKWLDGVGNIGLGLVRLEMMTDMVLTAEGSAWKAEDEFKVVWGEGEEMGVKAFVPDWIRSRTTIKKNNIRV